MSVSSEAFTGRSSVSTEAGSVVEDLRGFQYHSAAVLAVEKKLGRVEFMMDDLRASQYNNLELEEQWRAHRDEIMATTSGRSPGKQPMTKRGRCFLARLSKPKRTEKKKISDGIAKTYHDDLVHHARDKPGCVLKLGVGGGGNWNAYYLLLNANNSLSS
jgi:hypothetical protein